MFKEKYIDRQMWSIPNRAKRMLQGILKGIEFDLDNVSLINVKLNLPKVERIALQRLKKDKCIIIAKADKGDSSVVLNTCGYLELAHPYLNDIEMYQLLQLVWTDQIAEWFREYLKTCKEKGLITTDHDSNAVPFKFKNLTT